MLSYELLYNTRGNNFQDERNFLSPLRRSPSKRSMDDDHKDNNGIGLRNEDEIPARATISIHQTDISSMTDDEAIKIKNNLKQQHFWNHLLQLHQLEQETVICSDGREKRYVCKECSRQTSWICKFCKKHYCKDNQGGRGEKCFTDNIKLAHPNCGLSTM